MAQRYKRRSRASRAGRGILGQPRKWLPLASFESTFLGNAMDNINSQPDVMSKLKTLVNAHTGKVLGLNLFNDAPKFGVKIGFSNIGNPLVVAGATMAVAGIVGKRFNLPYVGKLKSLGMKIAVPAAIGSIFEGDVGVGAITTTPTIAQSTGSVI